MKNLAYSLLIFLIFTSCQKKQNAYNTLWAFCEADSVGKVADVFFVAPTVYGGSADAPLMSLADEETKAKFLGATNMERGIYDDNCRFFAPYYSQVGLWTYSQSKDIADSLISIAYQEVRNAFCDYLENYNQNRPIVLAGFSQGAEHCIRLLKEFGNKQDISKKLVACYAIGWHLTKDEVNEYPHLKPVTSETDLGTIITFSSEAPFISESMIIAEDEWSYSINPLSWTTSSDTISKSLNLGACFTDYSAQITREIPELTGAYIDAKRGALKITDVTPEEYPAIIPIFKDGEYHIYDYQFFYRNLEENVQKRISTFIGQSSK